jgi:uncharacterized protein YggE
MATENPPPAPLLSVRGEATLEVPPEIVELTITVSARDARRERVVERLSKRNEECLVLLKSYGDAVQKIETSRLAVYPELRQGGRKEQVRAYTGSIRLDVTIADFTILGELMVRLSEGEMTTLSGPRWRLRHDSPVRRSVRQAAARDAIARAGEYAEAVGAQLTGLVELADEGLTTDAGGPAYARRRAPMAAVAQPGMVAAEPGTIDLEPQLQVVRARVEARFTISQPERF